MADEPKERSEADAELEREIRNERKFTLAEAIGRMAGPGAMKGASPVARTQQAKMQIQDWLRLHLSAEQGALQIVLMRQIEHSHLLIDRCDQPLAVLCSHCQQLLQSEMRLKDLVRDADMEWGRTFDERPFFDREGSTPHPDDPFTATSVRNVLSEIVQQLNAAPA